MALNVEVLERRSHDGQMEGPERTPRLLVTWQNSQTRKYTAVGVLESGNGSYCFRYVDGVDGLPGFSGLLGFEDLKRVYTSDHLFPIFSQRVMMAGRSERPRLLEALALGPDAEPMEILERSGGHRAGDTLEILPIPDLAGGQTEFTFLAHGVRHCDGADEILDTLEPGDVLGLRRQPENPQDSRAVLVTTEGTALGWVPSPLLELVHALLEAGEPHVTVDRVNPRELGHHLRLLVRLRGSVAGSYSHPW